MRHVDVALLAVVVVLLLAVLFMIATLLSKPVCPYFGAG